MLKKFLLASAWNLSLFSNSLHVDIAPHYFDKIDENIISQFELETLKETICSHDPILEENGKNINLEGRRFLIFIEIYKLLNISKKNSNFINKLMEEIENLLFMEALDSDIKVPKLSLLSICKKNKTALLNLKNGLKNGQKSTISHFKALFFKSSLSTIPSSL